MSEAREEDGVFFTPMVIVRDASRRTIVVGDLRARDTLASVLEAYGVTPLK